MPRTSLTRRIQFSAAHRYRRPEWDDARNAEVFGKCARPHFHGHTYHAEITVTGPVDPETGFVVNLGLLDTVLARDVVERLDHANLNLDIAEFAEGRRIPSSEELAAWIAEVVRAGLGDGPARVRRVTVAETPELIATWEADD
jgi:6-pyruvoyltetrahydropterin/6-carboxytetrahydropterin synthase